MYQLVFVAKGKRVFFANSKIIVFVGKSKLLAYCYSTHTLFISRCPGFLRSAGKTIDKVDILAVFWPLNMRRTVDIGGGGPFPCYRW